MTTIKANIFVCTCVSFATVIVTYVAFVWCSTVPLALYSAFFTFAPRISD